MSSHINSNRNFAEQLGLMREQIRPLLLLIDQKLEDVKNGHHDIVIQHDENSCRFAAVFGHLAWLKYLRENGCQLTNELCTICTIYGHFEMLQYLHQEACPWDDDICVIATRYGHLNILQYLHEEGCAWTEDLCEIAIKRGYLECLKYARENGCPHDDEHLANLAIETGQLAVLQYLYGDGFILNESVMTTAVSFGQLDIFCWAQQNNCPYVKKACILAATENNRFADKNADWSSLISKLIDND